MRKQVLETKDLLLCEMNESVLEDLKGILQDDRVMYAYNGAFSHEECLAWLQKQMKRYHDYGFGLWGVWLKGNSKMIGQCGITMQEYLGAQVPEVGYLLAYKYWHRGYAVQASHACLEYGFNTLKLEKMYSTNEFQFAVIYGRRRVGRDSKSKFNWIVASGFEE